MAFTLSQAGMVRHWWREPKAKIFAGSKAIVNGVWGRRHLATLSHLGISKFRKVPGSSCLLIRNL